MKTVKQNVDVILIKRIAIMLFNINIPQVLKKLVVQLPQTHSSKDRILRKFKYITYH
jgi:hypothetical protein